MKYTVEQFKALEQWERDKIVAEGMGKCWHEWNESITSCKKCEENFEDVSNTDYSTPEGEHELLMWCGKNMKNFHLAFHHQEWYAGEYVYDEDIDDFKWFVNDKSLSLALQIAVGKVAGVIE